MSGLSNIEIAKPFIQATMHVMSTMVGMSATPGKPYVKKTYVAQGDVSAIIGITGDKSGSVSVSFTKQCAIGVIKGMLGDDIQDIISDTKDAVGEIANMVSGQARSGLAEMGLIFQGSTPSIIMGDSHLITHLTNGDVIAIPFTTDCGDFTVEFCFDS